MISLSHSWYTFITVILAGWALAKYMNHSYNRIDTIPVAIVGENYCHGNCVNLVWMLYLGMRGTSVLNIDCYWLNERVCVNCPLVRAVTDTRHLSMSWMMCWLQLDTWAQDAVWCGPLVTELPALKPWSGFLSCGLSLHLTPQHTS